MCGLSVLSKRCEERGSALIYLLFIISFVAIVGAAMLLTTQQGLRFLVSQTEKQTHYYRAEGAADIVLEALRNEMASATPSAFTYISETLAYEPRQLDIIVGEEETTINVSFLQLTSTIIGVLIQDSRDPLKTNREFLVFAPTVFEVPTKVGDYELPPDSPVVLGEQCFDDEDSEEDCPGRNYGCLEVDGQLFCEAIEQTFLYPLEGEEPLSVLLLTGFGASTEGNNSINYSAPQGIYVEPSLLSRTGQNTITMNSEEGFIIIDFVNYIETNQGSSSHITLTAGRFISARGTRIYAEGNITMVANKNGVNSGKYIDLTNASLTANKNFNNIFLTVNDPDGEIRVDGTAFNKTAIASPSTVRIVGKPVAGCISGGTPEGEAAPRTVCWND